MNEYAPSNKLVITSAAILLLGLTLAVVGFIIDLAGLLIFGASIVGASAVLVYRLFKARRNKEFAKELTISQKDERMMKIYIHAGNTAFWIGFCIVIVFSIITATKNAAILLFPTLLLSVYLISALYYMKNF